MAYNGLSQYLWRNKTPWLIMGKVNIYGVMGRHGLQWVKSIFMEE